MKIKSIINLEGVGGWGLTFWVVLAKVIVVVNDDEKKKETFANVYLQNEHSQSILDRKCIHGGEESRRDVRPE